MVDYVFSNAAGVFVKVRTDAVDTNMNNFTILEVNDSPNGIYSLSNALQVIFGRNIAIGRRLMKDDLISIATTNSYNLTATAVGVIGSAGNAISVSSVTLVAPGSFVVATGSGASGTMALTWLAAANASNYVIDRATNVGFTTGVTLGVFSGSALLFNDSGLIASTAYFYRIRSQAPLYTDSAYATGTATSHS